MMSRELKTEYIVYPVGKKILSSVFKMKDVEIADVSYLNSKSGADAVKRSLTDELTNRFLSHEIGQVVELLYFHFKSIGSQALDSRILLPVSVADLAGGENVYSHAKPYIYEPDSETIFRTVYSSLCEGRIYMKLG